MQSYLRWAREHGVVAFKGESYAAWAVDGPKLFVLNNLLWDPDQDVEALLKDYYVHAFGAAAEPMQAYFRTAEQVYERRRTPDVFAIATWHPGESQFEHVRAEDMAALAAALTEAGRRVRNESPEGNRVLNVQRAFTWCERYWRQEAVLRKLRAPATLTDESVRCHGKFSGPRRTPNGV